MVIISNNLPYKQKRRNLRKNGTIAERILWSKLQGKRFLGKKFYRQYSIGSYILDFYCHSNKLAIELDGSQHLTPKQIQYDDQRSAFLEKQHIRVIRFWDNTVFNNLDGVLEEIFKYLHNNGNSPQPSL